MYDVICFSHLRWDFVFQRPQHLLSRCALERRVFFIEEPVFGDGAPELKIERSREGVYVVVPLLPHGCAEAEAVQSELLRSLIAREKLTDYVVWYYTPMALPVGRTLSPLASVYDCMDQLAAFKGAPSGIAARELELFEAVNVVFTGGYSLYESKRGLHPNVHPFPSSVDVPHFARARGDGREPADQAHIGHPRLGFFGVIDERMNLELVDGIARARPDWQVVLVGPVVKIDESMLPRRPNIHYLGSKSYLQLPEYIAGWDVALLPFAKNESTEFISPTKTPEYLAAGRPVVSTSVRDVVRPYGEQQLVRIADDVAGFVSACAEALEDKPDGPRQLRADSFLAKLSWDATWEGMQRLLEAAIEQQSSRRVRRTAWRTPTAPELSARTATKSARQRM